MILDEGEVYFLLQVLDFTVNAIATDQATVLLLMELQEEALELLEDVTGDPAPEGTS